MKSLKERFSEFPINTKKLISGCFLLLITLNLAGQTRKELEQRRNQILDDIQDTEQSLKQTASDRSKNLKLLNALETRIGKRQDLIKNIENTLEVINEELVENDSMWF